MEQFVELSSGRNTEMQNYRNPVSSLTVVFISLRATFSQVLLEVRKKVLDLFMHPPYHCKSVTFYNHAYSRTFLLEQYSKVFNLLIYFENLCL